MINSFRWMPAEALFDDEWSMKSDVYAFAVVIWELFTIGELPYKTLSNEAIIEGLKADKLKLTIPGQVPKALQELMQKCWLSNCKDRPTFSDCAEVLSSLHAESVV